MRIVGGVHKGRTIAAPKGERVRPTSDRTREALFNILAHAGFEGFALEGARVLEIAERCPVSQTLQRASEISSSLASDE